MAKKSTRPKKAQRTFTYADVAAYFAKHWSPLGENRYELREISILSEATKPLWLIRYDGFYKDTHINSYTVVVIEHNEDPSRPWLNVAGTHQLPEGCATPSDEDAEIARRNKAALDAYEAKRRAAAEQAKQNDTDSNV